ncbi:MAG: hypothetical protein K2X47_01580, partial [Bdellovibrionales bacterium]|nr:hypothetical protein [Bdellovibrionales bacterium]
MVDLRQVADDSLMIQTKALVRRETELTIQILYHLQEVESRRLHLQRGYASTHEFCVKYLGYSDGGASRRVKAARLLRDVPEVVAQIESGALTLSVVAQAQSFFHAEKITTKEEKQGVLKALENKSSREAERELLKISPCY